MTHVQRILFIGATGYIGGSVLDALWKSGETEHIEITVYVRSEEKARKCNHLLGLKTISGPLSVLEEASATTDMVINCASADNLPLTEAVLSGAKRHYAATKVPTILLHTSGTGILIDNALGMYAAEKAVDDMDSDTINAQPVTQWHRNVDIPIVSAHKQGYIRSYIVYPGIIFGLATGRLVAAGLQNPAPTNAMRIAKMALSRGQAGCVGQMKNVWGSAHIRDVADLYRIIFSAIVGGKDIPAGPDGHYFAENGAVVSSQYTCGIAKTLYDLGLLTSPEVKPYTPQEMEGTPLHLYGTNSYTTSSRSRSLGWRPVVPAQDINAELKESLTIMLAWEKKSRGI